MLYRPRGAARDLFLCRDREVLIEGPSGTGKTRAVLEKVYALADKYPRSRHLLCRKTRASMTESVLAIFESHVLPYSSAGAHRSNRASYELPNGSTLVIGGLDNPDRIMSTEYDTASLFEATEATLDDWEKVNTRLRNGKMGYHQAVADCNPSSPSHWLNQRAKSGLMTRLLSRHTDNPAVTQEYLQTLGRLTGPRRARLYEGKWVGAEGLVYDCFDPAVHEIDPIPLDGMPRFMGVDFGFVEPTAVLWLARNGEGEVFVYREIYESGRLTTSIAEEVKRLSEGEDIRCRWADHDAQERALWEDRGVYLERAEKAISVGVQIVQERLQRHPLTGRPRLFVFKNSLVRRDESLAARNKPTRLVEELQSYAWDDTPDGRAAREKPKGLNDHACDALRYAVMGIADWGAERTLITFR